MVAASRPATSVPSEAASSDARASRKSPDRMARRLPQRALTLSTPCRVVGLVDDVVVVERADVHQLAGHARRSRRRRSRRRRRRPPDPAGGRRRRAASNGRNRLPPALTRCDAISVMAGSSDSTAASSRFSTRSRSAGMAGQVEQRVGGGHARQR